MFESICIKRQDDFVGNPIDLGFFAEALLFYQHVHIVADRSILQFLLRTCGVDVLFALLESGVVTMTYLENGTAITTNDKGTPQERHDFVTWEYPGANLQVVAPETLQELTGGERSPPRKPAHFSNFKSERFPQAIRKRQS